MYSQLLLVFVVKWTSFERFMLVYTVKQAGFHGEKDGVCDEEIFDIVIYNLVSACV